MNGKSGSDTYLFGRDSGNDIIGESYDSSASSIDRILLDDNISTDDVTITRVDGGSDLQISIANSDSTLIVDRQFNSSGSKSHYAIEVMEFADGTVWDHDDLLAQVDVSY